MTAKKYDEGITVRFMDGFKSLRQRSILVRLLSVLVLLATLALLLICCFIKGNESYVAVSPVQDIMEWEVIQPDGSSVDATLPLVLERGGRITVRATLPKVHEGQSLMVKINYSSLCVKVDGQTIYSVGETSFGMIRTMVGNFIAFAPMQDQYSGKTVELEITSRDAHFSSAVKHIGVVSLSDFIVAQAQKYMLNLLVAILYCLLGVLMFGLWLVFTFRRVPLEEYSKEAFAYAGLFLLSIGIWTFSDVHLAGMALHNLTASGLMNYLSFSLLPVGCMGMVRYMYAKSSPTFQFLLSLVHLNFLVQCALFLLGIRDFTQMLPVTQIVCIITVVTFIAAAAIDMLRNPVTEKKVNALTVLASGIALIVAIILYAMDKSLFSWLTFAIIIIVINIVLKLLSVAYQKMRSGIKLDEMRIHAYTDDLTSLYNRRAYAEEVEKIQKMEDRSSFILGQLDVNGLKATNDAHGHAAGDELLKAVAECIRSCFGPLGKCYRMGGDEFSILAFADKPAYEAAEREFAKQLSHWHGEYTHTSSASMGKALQAEHPDAGITELEKIADAQMYQAKQAFYTGANTERRKPK